MLDGFHADGGMLSGHPDRLAVPFVEASTGSLGHGLPIGVGVAYALKLSGNPARVFVLVSDGEIQEGSVWEAANQASRLALDNLVAIVDANGLQCFERTDRIMPRSSYAQKWAAFGWSVETNDGHDLETLTDALKSFPVVPGMPSLLIARTVKGKGVSAFEDRLEWHFRSPSQKDLESYCRELDAQSICKDPLGTGGA
jgi:transketolase